MKTKINEAINDVLKQFGNKYFIEDVLHKNKVIQDLDNYDEKLLEAFISNDILKSNFTIDIAGNMVLQINKLIALFEADEYWKDSYTKYSKKIGLTAGGKFIDESSEVVLDFPYKDAVLKASMSKEDMEKDELRPDEPFLNEVIAKEEIDVLLDNKILVNAKKYDENGEREVDSFGENDNLILKGNNLLALHTLKEKYAGKVKLIYIDPPYNTGGDAFLYNDQFNHSTWLTFMKNRLEIAHELLANNGSIFIQIDAFEDSYLKVLMDSIFGRENFRNKITWKRRGGSANPAKQLNNVVDYILWYSKDIDQMDYEQIFSLNDEHTQQYVKERFNNVDENGRKYMKSPIQSPNYRENLIYEYKGYKTPKKGYSVSRVVLETWDKEGKLAFPDSKDKNINRKIYLDEYKGQPVNSLWTDIYVINPMSRERVNFFGGQKPEGLIKRVLEMVTRENDIVLDFFMGSGTTQAVAHKMNRRYIGVEQMDYINTVSVPRLQTVIEGEQGGISQDVEWKGGGSFVYVELMEKNRGFLNSIRDTETQADLRKVFEFMLEEAEIDFRVDLNKVKDTLHELSLNEQKKTLIKIIDKNQLYYNYSEIDDGNVRDLISDHDYNFNKNFYNKGGE